MITMIDIIKNAATIIGCCISFITLMTLIIKPLRERIKNQIIKVIKLDKLTDQNLTQDKEIEKAFKEIDQVKNTVNKTSKDVGEIKALIFTNERDRLRGELFNCGNRCRRGIPLTLEEYRYIQEVYKKYNSVLKCNSIGTDEYQFICTYFNSIDNQEKIK